MEGGLAVTGWPGGKDGLGSARRGGGGAAGRAVEVGGWSQGRAGVHTMATAKLKAA
jgi:hypothetical protein